MSIFIIILVSVVYSYSENILTIENTTYSLHSFFSKYPKKQWERADSLQKDKMITDFITRELCVKEAKNLGLQNDPETYIKIENRKKQILVNESYEHFVAIPLIPVDEINLARKNAKKDVFVNHILIGHEQSYLARPPKRSLDEALLLTQQIKQKFLEGMDFALLAEKYSDDVGVTNNAGTIGWVSWGQTVSEFQSAAFGLDVGKISNPILTNFGYHLIIITDIRDSDYKYMKKDEYENLIINIAKNTIREELRPAAINYDNKMLKDYKVLFNMNTIDELFELYIKLQEAQPSDKKNNSLFLNSYSRPSVVCVYSGNGYGVKWFANKLNNTPNSRWPKFQNSNDILSLFQTYILQDIAYQKALSHKIDSSFSYTWKERDLLSSILYDKYLNHLVNSVENPDSVEIIAYYNKHKQKKYMDDEKITIREIKVLNKKLADSIYDRVLTGESFEQLAQKYSMINKDVGGLYGPFSRKQSEIYFDMCINMQKNQISSVFASSNSTFSIIMLEDRIPATPKKLNLIYSNIESLLLQSKQKTYKESTIKNLKNKYAIILNTSLLYGKTD